MKVFLAGASGAIGKRLVPMLVEAGHQVTGTTRSSKKADALRALGAEPVVLDALDRDAVVRAVAAAKPDVVVHELTSIPPVLDFRRFDALFAQTNALRTRGVDNLLEAAQQTGVRRFVAQSFGGWPFAAVGSAVKSEEDPLETTIPAMQQTLEAIRYLESRVTGAPGIEGIVLRYALLYGPASVIGDGIEKLLLDVRKRRLPIVGNGAGVWSFLHIDDAAAATKLVIERGAPGVYNVADDDPAASREVFTELARIVGAKPPMHVPAWLARLLIGAAGLRFMTQMRGVSNRKAKESLGWTPRWPTWREGLRSGI